MPRLYILELFASLVLVAMAIACASDSDPAVPDPTVGLGIAAKPADALVPAPTATPAPTETLVPARPPTATLVPTPAPTETSVPARPPTASLVPTPPPTRTPAPASSEAREMTPTEIYAMLYPSVAYIQTPTGYGSGFLVEGVEGGYLITNHHVIWPFKEVRVVFPDGTDMVAPVAAWDPLSDIAVLGPVNAAAPPLELGDGENLAIGSELYLLGYPGEDAPFSKPTIVSGVLSGYRNWKEPGITYFQTDAAIAGGQSGGVLVNAKGEVIGISGLTITEANYALVASATDLAPIVRQLIQGRDPWGIGNRGFREEKGGFEFSRNLRNHWDSVMFLPEAGSGEILEIEIESPDPAGFRVADWQGNVLLDVDNGLGGTEHGSTEVLADGQHFLIADSALHDRTSFDISSSAAMHPFTDPDDGRRLHLHEAIAGNIDYPGDRDWFSINLAEGETVRISVDSWNIDTVLRIDFPGSRVNQVAYDDDSGGGLFGMNSRLVYRAPKTGEYVIAVQDFNGDALGGYFLSADRVPAGTDAFTVPPGPQEVDSPFGRMIVFESSLADFSVQVPASWTEVWPDDEDSDYAFQAASPERERVLLILEIDLLATHEEQTLEELTASVQAGFSEDGFSVQQLKESGTSSGDPLVVFDVRKENEPVVLRMLLSIQDERFGFIMYYAFEDAESTKALVEYSFETLESSTYGQYFQGRTLHVSVVSLERVPELRYSTVDPNEVIRRWTLLPSNPGNELVLVRLKVENHTAASATINIHRFAAELRDLSSTTYHPVSIAETAWQDFHGEPETLVRMDRGQCFDGARALIQPGTTVRWQSEADTAQYLAFEDTSIAVGPEGRAELTPGESVSHTFAEPGIYRYVCGDLYGAESSGEVRVMPAADRLDDAMRSVLFLDGVVELLKGHGVDGYLVFEVPAGTKFQDLRWLAGDTITIHL